MPDHVCTECTGQCAAAIPGALDFGVPQPIQTVVSEADGVLVRQIVIPQAGSVVPQHSHVHAHTTMLAAGLMRAWADGVLLGEFTAPVPLHIPARVAHTFLTLSDGVVFYCIHRTDRTGAVQEARRHELPGSPALSTATDPVCHLIEELPPPAEDDGVVIAEERFAAFWRDGQALFTEHAAEAGPRPGVTLDINLPLVEQLQAVGAAHIVTARCNGRLAGYVTFIIGPSIEDRRLRTAEQNTFYISPDFRGLGPRLHRAAIEMLRVKGVGEVLMRAGVRGAGPKLGTLYRRLGATAYGEMFSLILKAT